MDPCFYLPRALCTILPIILIICPSTPPPPSRPASSTWPDTSSQCWAQPSWCTGASRSRGSSTPGRTRRTNATGFCFAASKRAWKPNTHPPTDDAERRGGLHILPLSVFNESSLLLKWWTYILLILISFQSGSPCPKRPSFSMISCDDGTVGV